MEGLKTDDPKIRIKIQEDAQKKGRQGFSLIFNAVAEVEGDLTKSLVVPMRDAFENNESPYDIEDKLREVINPGLAKDIARSYDNVSRRLKKFENKSDNFYRKVRADDESKVRELENDERYVRLLYQTMRQGMTARAEFILQTKAKQFEEGLESLVDDQLKSLNVCLSQEELAAINLEEVAIKNLQQKLAENLPTLAETFFELADNIQQNQTQESEVVDTKTYYENVTKTRNETYTEEYKSGSCFKETKTRTKSHPVEYTDTEKRTRDVYEDIEYIELFLPSPKLMGKQWLSGVEKGKGSLWDILCSWILARLDYVSNAFEESAIDIINLAERALDKQLKLIELNFEEEKQFWDSFEARKNVVTEARKKLENNSRN